MISAGRGLIESQGSGRRGTLGSGECRVCVDCGLWTVDCGLLSTMECGGCGPCGCRRANVIILLLPPYYVLVPYRRIFILCIYRYQIR